MKQSCADHATTVHPSNGDQTQDRNGNAQSPPDVAPAASLAQQEAPSSAVTTEKSVSRLTSEVVVRESSEEEDSSADEDYSPESDVAIAGVDGEECDEESCQSADEDTETISIHLFDPDLHQQMMDPIQADVCGSRCFESKAKALELLLCSLS
ncbi:hypothetical protein JG687_00010008 [Phytophthora cactorum]|uniref:Uncharacterized protein n=1 Tax=Phytophthora cactorum TaxID=29920 RepID=A0A329RHD5_9STRA|nr:hypothetical protein Pcac1_g19099 [Phytophthora cactorum]KAG2801974.1 hypothetical protein PC112_g19821 [Phytophthora cactorum]KAG2802699.1 hypothetical protein PC111_g18993 [Phytophthora cactorum]KAG2867602.1 hypothetical protein PC113_g1820 [Phytophthora cactorum]KAG2896107.1 hypothetical protein PC114_g15238 [Phytophthora cactorum]